MKNFPRILFLDVLKEDELLVRKKFPEAKIVNHALSDDEIVKLGLIRDYFVSLIVVN